MKRITKYLASDDILDLYMFSPTSLADAADMLHSKKIVAFDLDGTLAESKQPLSLEMGKLLGELLRKTDVAVITGGSFSQIQKQFLPFLPAEINPEHNLYILPTSGSQRYEFDHTRKVWSIADTVPFPVEIKDNVLHVLREFERAYAGKNDSSDFFNSSTSQLNATQDYTAQDYDIPLERYGPRIEERGTQITFSALGQDAPFQFKKIWDPDLTKRHKIQSHLSVLLPDVDVNIGGSTSIDILPKGFNKATGLKRLLSQKQLDLADMLFVGDAVFPGGNDYAAFEAGINTVPVKNPQETAELIRLWS